MLNIENITVKISNSIILRDINMIAKKGLITCIMGKNGMGKTTLLETIIGHHVLSSGSIRFNHTNIEKLSPFERAPSKNFKPIFIRGLGASGNLNGLFNKSCSQLKHLVGCAKFA